MEKRKKPSVTKWKYENDKKKQSSDTITEDIQQMYSSLQNLEIFKQVSIPSPGEIMVVCDVTVESVSEYIAALLTLDNGGKNIAIITNANSISDIFIKRAIQSLINGMNEAFKGESVEPFKIKISDRQRLKLYNEARVDFYSHMRGRSNLGFQLQNNESKSPIEIIMIELESLKDIAVCDVLLNHVYTKSAACIIFSGKISESKDIKYNQKYKGVSATTEWTEYLLKLIKFLVVLVCIAYVIVAILSPIFGIRT